MNTNNRYRLETFGGLTLTATEGEAQRPIMRRKPLALLAVLACHPRGISREKLTAIFWPEANEDDARTVLRQTVYVLRRDLATQELFTGTSELRLNPDFCSSDVGDFLAAVDANDYLRIAALYRGPFLDGFHLRDSTQFEEWLMAKRAWLESQARVAIEALTRAAEEAGRHAAAVALWRQLTEMDPLSSRYAAGMMRALAASGDPASALRFAKSHETLLHRELETSLPADVSALLAELRTPPSLGTRAAASRASTSVASPAPSVVIDPVEERANAPMPLRSRRRGRWAVGAVAAAAAGVLLFARASADSRATPARSARLMVAPFSVNTADTSLHHLRDGIVDLLTAKLSGDPAFELLPPEVGRVAIANRKAFGDGANHVHAVAHSLGAQRVLTGAVVGAGGRIEISAAISDLDAEPLVRARVAGPSDSVLALVDGLAAALLALINHEREDRLPSIAGSSLGAVKAYLGGVAAYRDGQYNTAAERFRDALQQDSTFALAGLRLALASGWAGRPVAEHDLGVARAWASRNRLIPRDQAFLEAWGTGRIAALRATVDLAERRWDRALSMVPDWPEVWFEYADGLFHGGVNGAHAVARPSAAGAFRRALSLDSMFAPAIPHLLQIEAQRGDTAAVRSLARRYLLRDSTSATADYVRWRMAHSLHDRRLVNQLRARFRSMQRPALRWIIQAALFDGVAIEDVSLAATALIAVSASPEERQDTWLLMHDLAVNRGISQDARVALDGVASASRASRAADRLGVLDALYGSADTGQASASARVLAESIPERLATDESSQATMYKDLCVLGQWQLARGNIDAAAAASRRLRASAFPGEWVHETARGESSLCGALLDVLIGVSTGARDVRARLARLDSISQSASQGDAIPYYYLVRARALAAVGDTAAALRSLRQRWYFAFSAPYLSTYLLEESRYAVAMADSAAAIRAIRHYLDLRGNADPAMAPQVAVAQARLRALTAAAR